MKKYVPILAIILTIILFVSCKEDSTGPDGTANVKIFSKMTNTLVSVANVKQDRIQNNIADSIKVSKIRILISRIKLHRENEPEEEDNHLVNAGPFVFEGDPAENIFILTEGTVPAGLYDKIKFEFHRFSGNELSTYANDPVFADFATNDRLNIILDMNIYLDGIEEPFTFKGSFTSNLTIPFTPAIELDEDKTSEIHLQFDPNILFNSNGDILDPRDDKNENDLEKNIRDAIKALKIN